MFSHSVQDGDSSRIPKLGILAAVQLDGSASLYAVPHPRYLHSRAQSQFPNMPLCRENPVNLVFLRTTITDFFQLRSTPPCSSSIYLMPCAPLSSGSAAHASWWACQMVSTHSTLCTALIV